MHVQINEHALIARINRRLKPSGLKLRRTPKNSKLADSMSRFFVVGESGVIEAFDDLEAYARREGFISNWEVLEPDAEQANPAKELVEPGEIPPLNRLAEIALDPSAPYAQEVGEFLLSMYLNDASKFRMKNFSILPDSIFNDCVLVMRLYRHEGLLSKHFGSGWKGATITGKLIDLWADLPTDAE